jgi:hypothetical protein
VLFISVLKDARDINMCRVITIIYVKIDIKETGSTIMEGHTQRHGDYIRFISDRDTMLYMEYSIYAPQMTSAL